MAEQAQAQTKPRGLVEYVSRDQQAISLSFDTVRKYLVSGKSDLVTDAEIIYFMGTCKARGLNPFKKDCYLVKYTNASPAAIIVSIDYYRSRARAQDDCIGWESGIIVADKDEQITFRKGSFCFPGDILKGGWFKATPAGWQVPFEWSVNLEPFIKTTRDGDVTQFWREDNQPQQIAKVAESQGLRRLWPDEFQSLYTDAELNNAGELRDVTPIADPQSIEETNARQAKPSTSENNPAGEPRADTRKAGNSNDKPATDKKSAALAWVNDGPPEEILDTNMLQTKLKGLNQSEQLAVCSAYNARRSAILEEMKAGQAAE